MTGGRSKQVKTPRLELMNRLQHSIDLKALTKTLDLDIMGLLWKYRGSSFILLEELKEALNERREY